MHIGFPVISICATDSPTCDLCTYMLSNYITTGNIVPGTLIDRIVKSGMSPLKFLTRINPQVQPVKQPNGLVDSLKSMLLSENYTKPWSTEYLLVKLLTKSF